MTTTTTPTPTPIVLPAAVQHLIVPILSALAVFGGGLPTLFAQVDAAHGNGLEIAAAYTSFGEILLAAIVTFWVLATWLKLLFAVLALLGTVVTPFLVTGHFDLKTDGPLLVVAVANSLLTAFGQYVRTQTATKELIDARDTNVVTLAPEPVKALPIYESTTIPTSVPSTSDVPPDPNAPARLS